MKLETREVYYLRLCACMMKYFLLILSNSEIRGIKNISKIVLYLMKILFAQFSIRNKENVTTRKHLIEHELKHYVTSLHKRRNFVAIVTRTFIAIVLMHSETQIEFPSQIYIRKKLFLLFAFFRLVCSIL